MTQQDRDQLVALNKAKKGLITQRQSGRGDRAERAAYSPAAEALKGKGDKALVLGDPNNHDNQIAVLIGAGAPGGTWKVRLHGVTVTRGGFHAWIERDDSDQSAFEAAASDNTHTVSSLAAGRATIVAGAYSARDADRPLYFGSSAGPTRDGRAKPDIVAPGLNVAAASARQPATLTLSGTSIAAPAACGTVALLMAEALAKGIALSAAEIRTLLISTAIPLPDADPRYGVGRISANAVIQRFLTPST